MATEYIYLPNEIFTDLYLNIPNSSQSAFAYSYLYYVTYLYRYCKYINDNGNKVTQENIKAFLGYSPKNKKVDFMIKKGGILDNLNYTKTTTDYPLQFFYDENDILTFKTVNETKSLIKNLNNRNFRVKKPLKAFYRTELALKDKNLTGTFYEVENTHRIGYHTFKQIITDNQLGVTAFYIYGYLKHKNDIFKSGYQRSFVKIGKELHFSENTIRKYVNLLEIHNFISIERKTFDMNLSEEDYEANIYNII